MSTRFYHHLKGDDEPVVVLIRHSHQLTWVCSHQVLLEVMSEALYAAAESDPVILSDGDDETLTVSDVLGLSQEKINRYEPAAE